MGDTFTVTTVGVSSQHNTTTVNGQVVENVERETRVSLEANVVVRAVTYIGRATQSEYTVTRCTTTGENPQEVIPAGSVLLVNREASTLAERLTLQDGTLTEEQIQMLRVVIRLGERDDDASPDRLFGTSEPQRVGSSWPVQAERIAQGISTDTPLQVTPDNVRGQTTLVATEMVDDTPCQRLAGQYVIEGFAVGGVPEGTVFESTRVEMEVNALLPVDTSQPERVFEAGMQSSMLMRIPTPAGGEATVSMETRDSRASTYRW